MTCWYLEIFCFFVGPLCIMTLTNCLEARCSLLPAGVCSWDGWLLGMDGWEGWPWFQFATWLRSYQTRTFLKDFLPNSRTGRCRKHLKTWLFDAICRKYISEIAGLYKTSFSLIVLLTLGSEVYDSRTLLSSFADQDCGTQSPAPFGPLTGHGTQLSGRGDVSFWLNLVMIGLYCFNALFQPLTNLISNKLLSDLWLVWLEVLFIVRRKAGCRCCWVNLQLGWPRIWVQHPQSSALACVEAAVSGHAAMPDMSEW